MKIEVIGNASSVKRLLHTKFIVLSISGEIMIRVYPGENKYHSDLVKEANEELRKPHPLFIGAGYYELRDEAAEWNSSSCKEVFGKYYPSDSALSKEILKAITEYCNAL